jgi:ribosomal protein S18 acetylase RimI-like enzyme
MRPTAVPGVTLRAYCDDDLEFLCELYASTRADEMALLIDWSQEQKRSFLRQQFEAQHDYYQQQYPGAHYDVIELEGQRIGRLYVAEIGAEKGADEAAETTELRLMDIALLPQHRGDGLGGALVRELLDEAAAAGCPVSLHVEENNPARRLYQRLGFRDVADVSFYKLMHWEPGGEEPAGLRARDLS